jgi:hypothetical protein
VAGDAQALCGAYSSGHCSGFAPDSLFVSPGMAPIENLMRNKDKGDFGKKGFVEEKIFQASERPFGGEGRGICFSLF